MIKLIKSTFHNEADTKAKITEFITNAPMLSMGEQCAAFEQAFAKKQGRTYATFVNSGSSANLVLIQTLLNTGRLKQGDRVAFSALTWPTNVMPVIQLGLIPVPVDCELDTLNASLRQLQALTEKPACFFLTNVLGFCDDIDAIRDYCNAEKIILIEDNCESLGSKIKGTLLGNFGVAATFSFFVGHHLSTIEGGMIVTDDEDLYEMLALVRAHGWERNLPDNRKPVYRAKFNIDPFYARYTFFDVAYNVRPTEIQGFIGTLQLPYWDEIVSARERQYRRVAAVIAKNPDLMPLKSEHMEIVSNFAVPVIARNDSSYKTYRDRFEKGDVEIRPVIAGNMTHQPFYKKYGFEPGACPNADVIHARGFYFGNNPDMTEDELQTFETLLTP